MRPTATLTACLCLVLLAGPALAANPILDFTSSTSGGTISYGGGPTHPLIGSAIVIDGVFGLNTPQSAGNHGVDRGRLNFTSGPFVSFASGVYTFGAGGAASFTITGGVPDGEITNRTLLTGRLARVSFDTSSNTVFLFTADGMDTKDANLVAFFGLTGTSFVFGPAVVKVNPTSQPCPGPCAVSGVAFSVDVPNVVSTTTTVVPTLSEWGVAIMMAILLVVGLWAMRRSPGLSV